MPDAEARRLLRRRAVANAGSFPAMESVPGREASEMLPWASGEIEAR